MCLGKASQRDQGGMQREMPQVELPWKSHAESKGLGGGTITQLPAGTKPCPATAVTPFSCLLRSGAAERAARNAVPARATMQPLLQLPGAPVCPAVHVPLLLPSPPKREQFEFVVPKRTNTVEGVGVSPDRNESSSGPAAGKSLRGCFYRVRGW